jgi:hypothetical protein
MKQRENEMIKYKVDYGMQIKKIEIERETAHFVFYKGWHGREVKESSERFFNSYAEAKEYIVNNAARDVETAQIRLKAAQETLAKAEALTE